MDNRWAGPDGYEQEPPRVRYRIRDASGDVVDHLTSVAYDPKRRRYFHSLAPSDQHFADQLVALIQQACGFFYAPDGEYEALEGVASSAISDAEVRDRIDRLERGENTREAERTDMEYYPLTALPFDQQRALVEQIEEMKVTWAFEIVGEEAPASAVA